MKGVVAVVLTLGLCVGVIGTALCAGPPAQEKAAPWVQAFTPVRTIYVSPDGTGTGASRDSAMGFKAAVDASQPGDLIWMLEGEYKGGFDFTRSGEPDKPIVYRAMPGNRVTINGPVNVLAGYIWLWGIEFIDPAPLKTGLRYIAHVVRVSAPGAHVINCIIHNCGGGIGGWVGGPQNVFYGNIIYGMGGDVGSPGARPSHPAGMESNYPAYTQSDYDKHGCKYWVQNMFFDSTAQYPAYGFNFHGYTQESCVSGFYLKQNLFAVGQMIIGATKNPPHHTVVIENCFYKGNRARLGFTKPTQAEFRNNYLVDTCLDWVEFPGEGEKKFPMPLPDVVTGNEIYAPEWAKSHIYFQTSACLEDDTLSKGAPRIKPDDVWDNNTYSAPVHIAFHAAGKNLGIDKDRKTAGPLDLKGWQAETRAAGNEFDAHGRTVPLPTEPKVFIFANEYEPGRAHVIIYNWSKADAVAADLSAVAAKGAAFTVHAAKRSFDKPIVEGKYEAPVAIPMKGEEFGAFLVRAETPPSLAPRDFKSPISDLRSIDAPGGRQL